jgi:hypothetical protein
MSVYARLSLRLALFLVVVGVVYGVTSHEFVGTPLLLIAAGGSAFVGWFIRRALRDADADGPIGEDAEAGTAEPHVGPTIWPFMFSLAAVGFVLGAIVSRWLLVLGAVLFGAASVGWLLDIRHQWAAMRNDHDGPAPDHGHQGSVSG